MQAYLAERISVKTGRWTYLTNKVEENDITTLLTINGTDVAAPCLTGNHSLTTTHQWRIIMKYLALLCLLFKSVASEVSEDYMLLEDCPIFANWSNIPHIDDLYRNISLLGIAVAEDDVVMMYKRGK